MLTTYLSRYTSRYINFLRLRRQGGIDPLTKILRTVLTSRREEMSRKFFEDISELTSCLHHLHPEPREHWITSSLRTNQKYHRVFAQTKRYFSFVQYVLNHYQNSMKTQQWKQSRNRMLERGFSATCYVCKRFVSLGLPLNNYCVFNFMNGFVTRL